MGKPALLYAHGKHSLIGDLPVGVVTRAEETGSGLRIDARLHISELFAPVREAVASGALNKMSIRFEPIKQKWSADRRERTLLELRVPEVSIVLWPAYSETSATVRGIEKQMTRVERQEAVRKLKAGSPKRKRYSRAELDAKYRELRGCPSGKRLGQMSPEERIAFAAAHGVHLNGAAIRATAAE